MLLRLSNFRSFDGRLHPEVNQLQILNELRQIRPAIRQWSLASIKPVRRTVSAKMDLDAYTKLIVRRMCLSKTFSSDSLSVMISAVPVRPRFIGTRIA